MGSDLASLGDYYAATLAESGIDFDILFGPAYKGIPLASLTAASLYSNHDKDVAYAFNRKEAKTHGEGGNIVGRELRGKIAIIDDVITAGTAIRESMDMILAAGATPACVLIALDRQEKSNDSTRSAVQEVEDSYGIPVISIASLNQLKTMLTAQGQGNTVEAMQQYQNQYGIEI